MSAWPTTANNVISEARQDLGLGESPNGSNHNKITAWYGIGNGAWCAMAVAYWFREAGVEIRDYLNAWERGGRAGWAYTPAGVAAGQRAGLWHEGAVGVTRGDIVFYRLPGAEGNDFVNHVGICTGGSGTTHITSVEGNTSNVVAERTRSRLLVVGYIRVPYAGVKPTPSAPPFPGASAFQLNKTNPAVTVLDRQLIRTGYAKNHDGDGYQPGPRFTRYTRDNVRDFQHAQGWSGSDADGYPGPVTWSRLFTARAAG